MKKPKVINGYIVGSQPPKGYVDWHEWAQAQLEGGLEQVRCPDCGLYLFPQEQSCHKNKCKPKHKKRACPTCEGRGMRKYKDTPGLWYCYDCHGTGETIDTNADELKK